MSFSPFKAVFTVLRSKEFSNMDKTEDQTSRETEVEKLSSLVSLVDLLHQTGPDVDVPDDGGPGTVNDTAHHTEGCRACHQQTLLDNMVS